MPESYTGNEGTEAQEAGLDVMDGGEKWFDGWRAINKTRDYIAGLRTWVSEQLSTVTNALGGKVNVSDVQTTPAAGKVPRWDGNGVLASAVAPTFGNQVANKAYVDQRIAAIPQPDLSSRVAKAGDTMTGHLYLPNAVAADAGYTIAYINHDGRVSRGASSERYKEEIAPIDPAELGDIFPQLHTFVMKDDAGRMQRVGYIAERLNEHPATERFVVYAREPIFEDVLDEDGNVVDYRIAGSRRARDGEGNFICESIDFIALLLAQVAQLHERVQTLEGGAS